MARQRDRGRSVARGVRHGQAEPSLRHLPEKVFPRIPVRRWGEGRDFGGIAVYLASDASAYHTGDTLVIDGGYSIF